MRSPHAPGARVLAGGFCCWQHRYSWFAQPRSRHKPTHKQPNSTIDQTAELIGRASPNACGRSMTS